MRWIVVAACLALAGCTYSQVAFFDDEGRRRAEVRDLNVVRVEDRLRVYRLDPEAERAEVLELKHALPMSEVLGDTLREVVDGAVVGVGLGMLVGQPGAGAAVGAGVPSGFRGLRALQEMLTGDEPPEGGEGGDDGDEE